MGMFGLGGKKAATPSKAEGPAPSPKGQSAAQASSPVGQVSRTKKVISPGKAVPAAGKSTTVKVVAPKAQVQVSKASTAANPVTSSVTRPITQSPGDGEPGSLAKARGGAPCRSGDKSLTEVLVTKTKLLTPEQAAQAAAVSEQENLPLDMAVVRLNLLTEELLVNALTQECYVPHLKVDKYEIRKKALDTISKDDALYYGVFPVDKLGSLLTLAMVNPLDQETIRTVESKTGLDVKRVVATRSEILQGIDKYYGGKVQAKDHSLAFTNDAAADPKPSVTSTKALNVAGTTTLGPRKVGQQKTAEGVEIEDIDDLLLGDEVVAPAIVQPLKADEAPLIVPADDILELNDLPVPEASPALEVRGRDSHTTLSSVPAAKLRTPPPAAKPPEFEDEQLDLAPAPVIKPGTARLTTPGKAPSSPARSTDLAKARAVVQAEVVQLIPVLDDEFQHAISHGKAHVFEKWLGLQTRNRIINAVPVDAEAEPVLAILYGRGMPVDR